MTCPTTRRSSAGGSTTTRALLCASRVHNLRTARSPTNGFTIGCSTAGTTHLLRRLVSERPRPVRGEPVEPRSLFPNAPAATERFDEDPARVRRGEGGASAAISGRPLNSQPVRRAASLVFCIACTGSSIVRASGRSFTPETPSSTGTPESGRVHHPLVLQAMQLDFDPAVPRFTVAFSRGRLSSTPHCCA